MILGVPAIVLIGVVLFYIFNKDFRDEQNEKTKEFLKACLPVFIGIIGFIVLITVLIFSEIG